MNTITQDVKYGVRMLANKPVITIIAVIALALGIGASTAIFSVVNAVLLQSLPYPNGPRLVVIWENNRERSRERNVISTANFFDWKEQSHMFDDMSAFFAARYNLTGLGNPEEITGMAATTSFFDVLGNKPILGRTFTQDDGVRGKDDVVVLSYGFWQKRFGGDRNVVGKTFSLDGVPQVVIGVMPQGFDFFVKENAFVKKAPDFWTPIAFGPNARVRGGRFMSAIGVLKLGVSITQARNDMDALGARLEQQYPDFNKGWGISLVPLQQQFSGDLKPALMILLGAVGFVLLIACANVANLLMARAVARQREFAIRAALGAGRWRIMRQLLTEGMLLALAGCVIGLLLARWGIEVLLALSPRDLLSLTTVNMDKRVLGFAILISVLTSLIFGLLPALESSRQVTGESLKEGSRGTIGGRSQRALNWFVVVQVALSLVLLIGSGLMIKSLTRLQSVNPGFDPQGVVTVAVSLPRAKYPESAQKINFFKQLLTNIRQLPGVDSAGVGSGPPFAGIPAGTNFTIEGRPPIAASDEPVTGVRMVDQEYFKALRIPLLQGRGFTDREVENETHVVIINEAMARQHFANENPIGRRITIEMKRENHLSEIIGVVGNVKWKGLDVADEPMAYWPEGELPDFPMMLVVKTKSEPTDLSAALQREVLAVDKDQPISEVRTMNSLMAESIARTRFATLLLGIFAGVAFVLASVGIYGVMSYSVTQRTNEIGIRMALGATGSNVLGLVLRRGLILAGSGVVVGLIGSFALTRLLTTMLFGVSATDPVTFVVVAVLLTGVALLATYIPARRAMKVDPLVALRYE
jgi:putative ABC transport system permease protein